MELGGNSVKSLENSQGNYMVGGVGPSQRRRQVSYNNSSTYSGPNRRWSSTNPSQPLFGGPVNSGPILSTGVYTPQELLSATIPQVVSGPRVFPLTVPPAPGAFHHIFTNIPTVGSFNDFVGTSASKANNSSSKTLPSSASSVNSNQNHALGQATWGVIVQKNSQQALISCNLFSSQSVHFIPFARKDYISSKFQDLQVDDVVLFHLTSENNKWCAREVRKYVPVNEDPAGLGSAQDSSVVLDTVFCGEVLSIHENKKKGIRERSKSCSVSGDAHKTKCGSDDDGVIAYTHEKEQFYLPFCLSDVKHPQHLQVHDQVQFLLKQDFLKNEFRAVHIVKLNNSHTTVFGRIKSLKDNYGFLERADSVVEVYFPFHAFPDPAYLKEGQECAFTVHSLRNGRVEAQNIRLLQQGSVHFMEEGHAIQHATVMRPPNSKRRLDEQSGQLAWIEDNCRQMPFGFKCQNNGFTLHPGDQVTFRISRDQRDDSFHVVDVHLPSEQLPRGVVYSRANYPPDSLGEQSGLRAPRFLAYVLRCPTVVSSHAQNQTNTATTNTTTSTTAVNTPSGNPCDGLLVLKEFGSLSEADGVAAGPLEQEATCAQWLTSLKALLWQCENKTLLPTSVEAFHELLGELFGEQEEERPLCVAFSHDELLDLEENGPVELFQLVEMEPLRVSTTATTTKRHTTSMSSTSALEGESSGVDVADSNTQIDSSTLHAIRMCRSANSVSVGYTLVEGEIVVEATDKAVRHSVSAEPSGGGPLPAVPVVPGTLGVIRYSSSSTTNNSSSPQLPVGSVYYSLASLAKGNRNRPRVGDRVRFHLVEVTPHIRFAAQVVLASQPVIKSTSLTPPTTGILKSRSSSTSNANAGESSERKYERASSVGSAAASGNVPPRGFRKQLSYEQPRGLHDVMEHSVSDEAVEEVEEESVPLSRCGWIVFLGDSFGFIESSDHSRSLYFPLSLVDANSRDQLVLGQPVTYTQTVSPANQQLMARDVRVVEKPNEQLCMPMPQPTAKYGKVILVAGKTGRAGERLANGTIEEDGTRQQFWYSPKSLRFLATFLQLNDRVMFHLADCSDPNNVATQRMDTKYRTNWAVDVTSDMPRFLGRVSSLSEKQGKVSFRLNDALREMFQSAAAAAAAAAAPLGKKMGGKAHAASVSEPPSAGGKSMLGESGDHSGLVHAPPLLPKIRARSSTSVSSYDAALFSGSSGSGGNSLDVTGEGPGVIQEVLPPPTQVVKPLTSQSTVEEWEKAAQLVGMCHDEQYEEQQQQDDLLVDPVQQLTFPVASVLDVLVTGGVRVNDVVTFQICTFAAGGAPGHGSRPTAGTTSFMATNLVHFRPDKAEGGAPPPLPPQTTQRQTSQVRPFHSQTSSTSSSGVELARQPRGPEEGADSGFQFVAAHSSSSPAAP